MTEFFVSVVNMSISAGWIVLAVLLLRLLLKKAPKWITVLLWGIVAVRLICPFTIESALSLIPSAQTINPEVALNPPAIDSGVPIVDNIVNPVIGGATVSFQPEKDLNFFQFIMPYLAGLWLVGIAVLLVYTVVSYVRVKRKIGTAILLRDNIFQSESVISPFVLGLVKPRIYLPFNMNEQDMEHVIAHEQAHIRRKDHWWKPFGFLLLTIHWFNPLMWLGYVLLCRDIELACDEKVIKELNIEQKADYSQALLTCSVNRRMIAACPLAFGEVGVKNRVKSVLNYKKPAFWIVVIAIIVSVVTAICFLTNPQKSIDDELSVFLDAQIAEYHYSEGHTNDNFIAISQKVLGVDKSSKETTVYMWVLYNEYSYENGAIQSKAGAHIPTVITVKREGSHGHYKLVEYWTPRDGSYYAKDIKEKFPWYLHGKALDSQRYIGEQKAFCENAAREYFNNASNISSSEKLTWTYRPMLSFTGHSFSALSFDFEYTHIEATCTEGEFCNLEVEGQPRGTTMQFEKGKNIYWTPSEAVIDKLPKKSEVILTVFNNRTQLYACTVIFECVSRDLGSAEFEIYLKDSDGLKMMNYDGRIMFVEQSSISNIGGSDEPTNIIVGTTMDQLKLKYPQFFNVSTDGGLKVYIWQMSKNNYQCYLVNRGIDMFADQSFAFEVGATIAEMRAILTTYDIEQKDITIHPVRNPLSSYYYEIDDAYRAKVEELFWSTIPPVDAPETASDLNNAIAKVLNEKYLPEKPDGLIHIENYHLLANETASGTPLKGNSRHMKIANVYLLVYHMKYSVNGGRLEEVEGDFVPTAISFSIDESSQYTLKEYWTPRSGANYEKDVLGKFPGESATDVLNTEQYAEDLIKENWRLANEYLNQIKGATN